MFLEVCWLNLLQNIENWIGGDGVEQVKKIKLDYHSYSIDKMINDVEKLKKKYPKAKIYIRVQKN